MVTKKVIEAIYKTCRRKPDSPDELDIALLFNDVADNHKIHIDEGWLTIGSLPAHSPFHRIALKRIHGIIEFEDEVAVVLHSSIIFLNKHDSRAHIHVKEEKPSFMDRLRYHLSAPE